MKRCLSIMMLTTILVTNTSHACKGGNQNKWIYLKGVVSEIEKNPKIRRLINTKRVMKTSVSKEALALMTKLTKLNQKVMNTKSANNKRSKKHIIQYSKIERQADKFAAAGGDETQGIGACMSECGDYFPGTGGGSGINRVACKIGCLAHGG